MCFEATDILKDYKGSLYLYIIMIFKIIFLHYLLLFKHVDIFIKKWKPSGLLV